MTTIRTNAFLEHPACRLYDETVRTLQSSWNERHKGLGRVATIKEDEALRVSIDEGIKTARVELDALLAAEGLMLVEGWREAECFMDVGPITEEA